ncbi:YdcH family protein [Algimonas porphyrae]|uniref:DUF465 domain-containing protein n=2 Tax=Algimonas porphyrae TaxID=1128113 RepID=A0ABQ5V174_9PROT|nr:YdcH family protein [Algimonas porphyrae]GLQ21281.1 hypothetical protein GCM10007854_22360 [Algimonas porphyrae]
MALSAHLEKLQSRHGEIEDQIARELRSPSPDHVRISQLKRQKLQIKDTMSQKGSSAEG